MSSPHSIWTKLAKGYSLCRTWSTSVTIWYATEVAAGASLHVCNGDAGVGQGFIQEVLHFSCDISDLTI